MDRARLESGLNFLEINVSIHLQLPTNSITRIRGHASLGANTSVIPISHAGHTRSLRVTGERRGLSRDEAGRRHSMQKSAEGPQEGIGDKPVSPSHKSMRLGPCRRHEMYAQLAVLELALTEQMT